MWAVATWWHLTSGPGQGPGYAPDFWWLFQFRPALRVGSGDESVDGVREVKARIDRYPNRQRCRSGLQATTCIDLTLHVATTEQHRLLGHPWSRVAHGLDQILQMPAPVKVFDQVHDDRHLAPTADHLQAHGQVDAFILQ